MESIQNKLKKLKVINSEKEEINKKLKKGLETFFLSKYSDILFDDIVDSFYLKNKTLIINAKNKVFANDIYFQKEEILKKIKSGNPDIRELVIK